MVEGPIKTTYYRKRCKTLFVSDQNFKLFENFPKQLKLLCVETQLLLKYVKFLHTEEEITPVSAKFEEDSGFKNCIGIIDGTHVAEHVALTALGKDIIYVRIC